MSIIIPGSFPARRLRRSRTHSFSRRLVAENQLTVDDLILPVFIKKGENLKTEIEALEDIANKIDFLFLDGQFTSLPDISAEYKDKLTSAPSMEIVLNELGDKP